MGLNTVECRELNHDTYPALRPLPNECYPCWSRSALLPRIHLSECHRLLQNNLCHCSNPHPCFLQCSRFTGLAPVRAASHPFVLTSAPVKIHILPLSPHVSLVLILPRHAPLSIPIECLTLSVCGRISPLKNLFVGGYGLGQKTISRLKQFTITIWR